MRWLLLLLCIGSLAHADPIADREHEADGLERASDFASLVRAAELREALGQRAKWIADANRALKLAPTKEDAANVMWNLGRAFEGAQRIAHLRAFLRRFGEGGDHGLLALAEVAQHAWRTSCRVAGVHGLCAEMARAHPRACDQKRARWAAVARDPVRARPALVDLAEVTIRVERANSTDPEVRAAYADAKLTLADAQLEVMIARRFPKLSFTNPGASERSSKRFEEWVSAQMKTAQLAQYEAVIGLKVPRTAIAAVFRIAQQTQIFASQLVTSQMPHRLESGVFGREKRDAFCERMAETVEPLDMKTRESFWVCAVKSTELDVHDARSDACMRALITLDPENFPAFKEVVARPGAVW